MNIHVGARRSRAHTPTVFIEVTPELIRQLAAIVEAGIGLLDQVEGDPDLEPSLGGGHPDYQSDPDLEDDDADLEDDNEDFDPSDFEPECEDEGAQCDDEGVTDWDGNLTVPETTGGLCRAATLPQGDDAAALRATFDPRLALRPEERAWNDRSIPRFPHEPADRVPVYPTRADDWAVKAFTTRIRRGRRRTVATIG